MAVISQVQKIKPEHRLRFKQSRMEYGWLEFTPYIETVEDDLRILKKYKDLNIVVNLRLKNDYCPSGFDYHDTELLTELSGSKGLSLCSHFTDISFVANLKQVEHLRIHGLVNHELTGNADIDLNLNDLSQLRTLYLPILRHKSENYNFQDCRGLKHLFLPTHYKAKSSFAASIGNLSNLQTLSMHRPRFKALDGIQVMEDLKYLEIDYSKNLCDLSDLAKCSNLVGLELQNCPNILDLSMLKSLRNLHVLHLWNCKNIESLKWVQDSQVEYLNFYSSNIRDGDLSFIESLPNLKVLRFQNKKHYNRKLSRYSHIPQAPSSGGLPWDFYNEEYNLN